MSIPSGWPGVSVAIETACSKLTGLALLLQDEFNPLNHIP